MQYTHRNGEAEPPTVEGRYWFRGALSEIEIEQRGIVTIRTDPWSAWPDWIDGWFSADEIRGEWWGPIVPPWSE